MSVVFCDVVGSTALGESVDPEALRALLAQYFERMKSIVEAHGGVVEKFIGDAVMAVFGLPAAHEDDAVRALRAAAAMRSAFSELGVEGRIGVMTGEVVTGTEERLATGDAVNVAARLQQAAEPGEILAGEPTMRLAAGDAEAEPVEPLELKGKSEPVPAFRLLSVAAQPRERSFETPLVGRERELRALAEAWERAREERRCEQVTIVAAAGVGKSRLAAEFLAAVDADVVRGRCLSYGEGITYWPVVEVLKQLEPRRAGLALDAAANEALDVVLGAEGASSTDEIAWAFRKLLEAAAAERPLIVVFDDIQWAEEALLDLLEHVALLSTTAPILLLCMSRPELLDRRGSWAGVVRLEPLTTAETEQLLELHADGVGADLKARIVDAAGGNPLFVEEMTAMLEHGDGDGVVVVPPSIQALLAARLDQLDEAERVVLERGAVEGELFHRGTVQALAPEEPRVTARLTALVRRELVRPDRPQIPAEDAFRFRHLLIRDAAYDSMPKALRADLHERFAGWLDTRAGELVELDELVGFHLEQAYRYRVELGTGDDALAAEAGERLRTAGQRALHRMDVGAAVKLLARAGELLPEDRLDIWTALLWADSLFFSARFDEGVEVVEAAARRGAERGDRLAELLGTMQAADARLWQGTGDAETLRPLAEEILRHEGEDGDPRALMRAWMELGVLGHFACRYGDAAEALERSLECASRAGETHFATMIWHMLGSSYTWGPVPVEEALERHRRRRPRDAHDPGTAARLEAMRGNFGEARALHRASVERAAEFGDEFSVAAAGTKLYEIERLAGDPVAAEVASRAACELLEAHNQISSLSTALAEHALALCELGRYEEAESEARRADEIGDAGDMITQIMWRQALAKVRAHEGRLDEGERLVREALALVRETDMVDTTANVLSDLAEVLELAGKDPRRSLQEALTLHEQKGNVVMAARVRSQLAA